jgi:pimeloyl-ACP methyl ester carboxylesterase
MSHSQTESRSIFSSPVRAVTTASGTITYAEAGASRGPVAVFVHGVFLHHGLWAAQLAELSDVRRCLAPDLLAHGGSALAPAGGEPLDLSAQARMIIDFLDALGVYQADLVGNDTGGAICQLAAVMAPDRFRSLTLTNCDVHDNWPPPPFMPIVNLARQGVMATVLAALAGDVRQIRSGLGGSFEHPDTVPDEVLLSFFAPFAEQDRAAAVQGYVAGMDNAVTVAIRDDLAKLTVPAQMVWGTGDEFFTLSWAQWLADTIPGAQRIVEVAGAKLFFPLERPDELSRPLRELWTAAAAA